MANRFYSFHSDSRVVAGEPLSVDVLKCRLKPMERHDCKVGFTTAQWARLKRVFPGGVCDFTRPGVGQVPLKGTFRRY